MPKNSNVLTKLSDKDILFMLINTRHHLHFVDNTKTIDRKIWMQLATGNNIKIINLCALFDALRKSFLRVELPFKPLQVVIKIRHFVEKLKVDLKL